MRNTLLSFLLASFVVYSTTSLIASDAHDKNLVEKAKNAVALLYSQDEAGGMRMHCTATSFESFSREEKAETGKMHTVNGYHFVSAAHCVGSDESTVPGQEKSAKTTNKSFYITFDEVKQTKKFYLARVMWVGYQHRGEDFSVFEVVTDDKWPTIPIGDETKESEGASFINVASPLGLGKQVFYGTISSLYLDRPVVEGDINWKGTLVIQLSGVNGGSSGSALIADDQQAIVGFLVGTIGGNIIIAIPATRFTAVKKAVEAGKYKWYNPDKQLSPDGTEQ